MTDAMLYVTAFKEVLAVVREDFGPALREEEAITIAIAIMQEVCKDHRIQLIRAEREERAGKVAADQKWREDPATPQQLDFLTKNKIPFTWPITKGQASDMIDAKVKEWQGEKQL